MFYIKCKLLLNFIAICFMCIYLIVLPNFNQFLLRIFVLWFFYSIYDVIDMMRLSMYRPRFVMFYPVLWTAIRNKRINNHCVHACTRFATDKPFIKRRCYVTLYRFSQTWKPTQTYIRHSTSTKVRVSGNMKKRCHAVAGISFSFRFINFC